MQLEPYLNFDGNAAEALTFYSKVFNGQVVYQQSYGDSPMETSEDWKDKVMHATFKAGDITFMVSDIMSQEHKTTKGTNIQLSLNFASEEEIDKTFAALSEGANITMPLDKTFWGAKFGMLVDKFGVNWMFNYDYEQREK